MINIYKNLCQLTNNNLKKHDPKLTMHFERAEGLRYSIFEYPRTVLLNIESDDEFVRECFYKILDRSVDEDNYKRYYRALTSHNISREDLIKELFASNERHIKQTALVE